MDLWDQDFVDLVVTRHFAFKKGSTGFFEFGAVQGEMDCRVEGEGDDEVPAFSWLGSDEGDLVSGCGWVMIDGKHLLGHLYFHLGDSSAFVAKKVK